MPSVPSPPADRRTFLLGAAALLVGACTSSDEVTTEDPSVPASDAGSTGSGSTTPPSTLAEASESDATSGEAAPVDLVELDPLTPAMFAGLAICAVPPSAAAGPFPSIEQLDRRDVTEGYPGHPFRLGMRVVDDSCQGVPAAEVEIWHTDASGDYSSYLDDGSGKDEGEGTTFCRGFQTADNDGIVEFQTIFPGWYDQRAVHIHVRVRIDGESVLTTQLYLDEAYADAIFETGEYAQFGSPQVRWADDGLIGDPESDGSAITLAAGPTSLGEGTLGLINLGVEV